MSKKGLRITFNAPVVLTFVFLCFVATLMGVLTNGAATQAFFATYNSSWLNPMTYVRLFTHVLGHGGWDHFLNNSMYLLLLGPILEEKYGRRNLIEVIPITVILVAVLYIGQEVYSGIFVQDNISNMAHIVGGLVGAVIGYSLNVKRGN